MEELTTADRRFGAPELVVLALYTGLLAWLTLHHEPWADEAQAWLLARDNSLRALLRQVHYEGTPALWHVLLWIEVRLHVTYSGMHWITSGFGVIAAFLLLRYSPFPRWAKLLLPFSAFLLFHAPVIARSYSLSIPLMFGLAVLYRSSRQKILIACVICGLLANTSLFGLTAAIGLAAVLLSRAYQEEQRCWFAGLLIVCGSTLIAVQQTIPAPDAEFSFATRLNEHPAVRRTFAALTGISVDDNALRLQKLQDAADAQPVDGNAPEQAKPATISSVAKVANRIKDVVHAAFFSVSSFPLLACAFYLSLLFWLVVHRSLGLASPFALMLVVGGVLRLTEHHVLIVWGSLIAMLWMAWPSAAARVRWIDPLFSALLFVVLIEQACWSVHVLRKDTYGTFDPGRDLALFLQHNAAGRSVETVTYYEVGSQPYLSTNPFRNVATSYWPWATGKEPAAHLAAVVADRPDMIVASTNVFENVILGNVLRKHLSLHQPFYSVEVVSRLEQMGYQQTHRFCGQQPMQFGYSEQNCMIVLEPRVQVEANPLNNGKH